MAKKTDKKKDASKSARKVRLGVTYNRTTHSWQLKHGRLGALELPPAGGSVPSPRQEGPAKPEGAGTSVPTATSSVYISPEHYHERILNLYMAGVLDAVEVVGRHRAILDLQSQVIEARVADIRGVCATGLPELLGSGQLATLHDELSYQIHRSARHNLIADLGNLRDQLGYFKGAYRKASAEIGEPAAQGILSSRHHTYLSGPGAFVPTWRTFLALVEKHGIELRFPH